MQKALRLLRLIERHWVTPLFLLPFAVLLAAHRWLGLSDAMLAASAPGERHWPLYNVALVLAFMVGINAYVLHTAWLARRNWALAALKIVALMAGWGLLLARL